MNETEITELCRDYGASILRRCRALLRDPDEAKDAAQEVMVTMFVKPLKIRGDLGAYVYRVTTNQCLNRLRAHGRRRAREQMQGELRGHDSEQNDPYESYAARALLEQIRDDLDPLGQEIFVYRCIDGMTQEEIATATGKSRRTVGKRLRAIEAYVAAATREAA